MIEDLREDKRDYERLLDEMKDVRGKLGNAYSALSDSVGFVPKAYAIDYKPADDGYLNNRAQEIGALYNSLDKTIIPRIEREIHDLEREIERLEEEEDDED